MTLDTGIPLDYHPDALMGEDLGPDLEKAKGALRAMYDTWADINEADKKVSDKAALALHAQSAVARAARLADGKLKDLRIAEERAKETLSRVLAPDEKESTAQEIRQHFKFSKEPAMAVRAAIQRKDLRSLKAVFEGPAFLSGLNEEMYETIREAALRTFAPEDFARVEQYGRAIAKLERAADQFTKINAQRIRNWGKLHEKKVLKKLKGAQ